MMTKNKYLPIQLIVCILAFLFGSYFMYLTWVPKIATLKISLGLVISVLLFNSIYRTIVIKITSKYLQLFSSLSYILLQLAIFFVSTLVYLEPKTEELLHNDYWFFNIGIGKTVPITMFILMIGEIFKIYKEKKEQKNKL